MQAWAQALHPGLEGSLALRPSSKVLMLGAGVLTTKAMLWNGAGGGPWSPGFAQVGVSFRAERLPWWEL